MKKSFIVVLIAMLALSTATAMGAGTYASNIFYNTGLKLLGTSGLFTTTIKQNSAEAANRILNIPALGANDTLMTLGTAQTITGVKTFTGVPVLPANTVTAANIQSGSAKRQLALVQLSPVTGAAADSTTYAGLAAFGRAGTVTRITFMCAVAPTVGTDTLEVLKNNSQTMINAATYDANSLTAYTAANATLTATGADLALTATDVVRCKYNAGAQTVDAQGVAALIEFEPTNF